MSAPAGVDVFYTDAIAPGYYVADRFARTFPAAIVAGPFDNPYAAAFERRSLSIGEDCEIIIVARIDSRKVAP